MSQLAERTPAQLLPAFWPLSDQHTVGHLALEAKPPSNSDEVLPLLLRLAAQSDAMRGLQTSNGALVSERGASALREEMADGLLELAERVDDTSAAIIRLRADALAGRAGYRETTLRIAAEKAEPPLQIVCGPMCTWRPKTRKPLHSFVAAVRHQPSAELMDALDSSLQEALDELRRDLDAPGMDASYIYPMHLTDLIVSAGEAAGHPKHFAYFMPEDEGVDGVPLEDQRTLSFRNVHLARYTLITEPLAEALLDGPRRAADVPFEATLLTWLRGHDLGHNVAVPETQYDWTERLGVEPFMMLQEALADVYGFLLSTSEPWLRIAGVSRTDMCVTHMAEMLHYMRRGPWHYGDSGAAYLELSFLAVNGFVEIAPGGEVRWTEEGLLRGMNELAMTMTRSTLSAKNQRRSSDLIDRYGWPATTPALQTLAALRWKHANVPTSVAFYRTDSPLAPAPSRPGMESAVPFESTVPLESVEQPSPNSATVPAGGAAGNGDGSSITVS